MKGTPGNVVTVTLNDDQMVLFARATVQAMLDNIIHRDKDEPQPAAPVDAIPRIGQVWHGQGGIYAGTVRGDEGQPDYHLILAEPDRERINWKDATEWAAGLDADGHNDFTLPKRREQAILFGNVKDRFADAWYWSCETHASDAGFAWDQDFNGGYQSGGRKGGSCRARAVRRLVIQ